MRVSDLIIADASNRSVQEITYFFGRPLAEWVLTISLPMHPTQDARIWGCSCYPKVPLRDLFRLYSSMPSR